MQKINKNIALLHIILLLIAAALFIFFCTRQKSAIKADTDRYTFDSFEISENGKGYAVFDNRKHDFILCLPEKVENAPLVVMLHGYGESAEVFRQKTAFEKDANERGYAVLYVTGAPTPEDPSSATGWNSGIGISSNEDVSFLCTLVEELCKLNSFDKSRIFAVGYSNGAFMTHRLALEANDTFSAVVCVAGMMPETIWNTKPEKCEISVFQITGDKDDVIPKKSDGSAKYSKAPAIEDVLEYYIKMNDLTLKEDYNIGKKSHLEKNFSKDTKKQVWNMSIKGGRHSWPDEQIVGFSVNQVIIEFLETQ